MCLMTELKFANWLQDQLDERGWRQADLVRASGIHSGYLSKLLTQERMPGVETCQAIARAFNMRDTDVMKIAGLAANNAPDDQTPSLREMARQGTIKAVVAFVMDRLSRDLELQISLRREITRLGLTLYTTTRGRIEDNPEANLLSNIEGAFSQHEIETLVRRSKMGRLGKAKSGKWPGVGPAPYGSIKVGERGASELKADAAKLKIVKQIYTWYTGWDGRTPIGLAKIAERLMSQGIPAPAGGAVWWTSTVSAILTGRDYLGYVTYRGIEVYVPALAIIPDEMWAAAQRQAKSNFSEAARNRQRDYLLARRLTCGCGKAAGGVTRKRSGQREGTLALYECSTRRVARGTYEPCHYGTIAVNRVDSKIWAAVRSLIDDPTLRAGVSEATNVRPMVDRVAEIDAQIAQHERQMDSLFERFGADSDGELSARAELKIRELRQAVLDLRAERAAAIDTTEATQRQAAQRASAVDQVKKLARKLDRAAFATKRQVIELLDVRVTLGRREDGRRIGWLLCVLLDKPLAVDLD